MHLSDSKVKTTNNPSLDQFQIAKLSWSLINAGIVPISYVNREFFKPINICSLKGYAVRYYL